MWSGARATRGIKGGKYFYECNVEQNIPADLPDPNVLRYMGGEFPRFYDVIVDVHL